MGGERAKASGGGRAGFLVVGSLCVLSFFGGMAVKRAVGGGDETRNEERAVVEGRRGSGGEAPTKVGGGSRAKVTTVSASTMRSKDSLEDLKGLPVDELYGRLALWMMDASEEEIAAYFEFHKSQESPSREITDLIFINWTRVNAPGAIASVRDTKYEEFAWWAWTSADPGAALAAAKLEDGSQVRWTSWGVGEFHPKWLRENFDQIPENLRGYAMSGLRKWGEVDDAKATLEFLAKNGGSPSPGLLRNFVRQDPQGAYEWFKENGESLQRRYGSSMGGMKMMVETLAESDPMFLQQLIAEEPPGARRREMEAVAFTSLLKVDPEAALEQARATKGPMVAATRLSQVGMRLVRTDVDAAFGVFEDLLTDYRPWELQRTTVTYPGGSSSSGSGDGSWRNLMGALVAREPERVMQMEALQGDGESGYDPPLRVVAEHWASYDVQGFAQWVVDQEDEALVNQHATVISNQLSSMHRYEESIEWVASVEGDRRARDVYQVLSRWKRHDPESAQRWLESSDLPEQDLEMGRKLFESSP